MQYRGFDLDRFQTEAIQHLADGNSVLVAAPTGTGKTIIADWMVDHALQKGKSTIYTAPIKALSNQKFRDYCALHGEAQVGLMTGDLVIRREAPIRVMTTEILRNMLLSGEPLDDLAAVILDEVHFLDDPERGTVWEEVLIYLPPHVRIVALSATLPNLDEFAAWMQHVRGHEVAVITETRRTVPLDFYFGQVEAGLLPPGEFQAWAKKAKAASRREADDARGGHPSGRARGRGRGRGRGRQDRERGGRGRPERGRGRDERKTMPVDLVRMVRDRDWLPLLYFVFSRRDTERFAKKLAWRFRGEFLSEDERGEVLRHLDEAAASLGTVLDQNQRDLYLRGIAYHHAGLHVGLKTLVERLYERKLIKVLFCTSTFALGINMPARTVVFHSLKMFNGREVAPLKTRQFMQKAGRAGRRGLDATGHVILRMDLSDYGWARDVVSGYRKETYEPVRSSFSLSWNSIVNLLDQHDRDHIRQVVDKSFMSWCLTRVAAEQLAKAAEIEANHDHPRNLKTARRMRKRAERADGRCWAEFEEKATFLRRIGYIGPDDELYAGAKILRHLQFAEIFMTELVLSGLLEDLEEEDLFAVLMAAGSHFPRGAHRNYKLNRYDRILARKLEHIRFNAVMEGAQAFSEQELPFAPELIPVARVWFRGTPLDELRMMIRSETDLSGTLIMMLRRAKDLAGQLLGVYEELPDRRDLIRSVIRTVSRDEVEIVG